MGKKRIVTQSGSESEQTSIKTGAVGGGQSTKKITAGKITANIISSFNNTIIALANEKGEVLLWSSAGKLGFKGSRKSTPYAATMIAKDIVDRAQKINISDLAIVIRGIGPGRDAAMRSLASAGWNVVSIVDDTPLPHNGVRPPKPRRV